MRIYVASSWRNERQLEVVNYLNNLGYDAYNFRKAQTAFEWKDVDVPVDGVSIHQTDSITFINGLDHPTAQAGFNADFEAMKESDAFLLLLPCGKSAHLEAGWAIGQGKPTCILLSDFTEPELMYNMADFIATSLHQVRKWLYMLPEPKTAEGPDVSAGTVSARTICADDGRD